MPICQGRATGPGQVQPCPDKRNDSTVRSRQGDLFLCDACTEFRFPTVTTVVTRAGSGLRSSSAAGSSAVSSAVSADATSRIGKAKKATKQSTTQSIGGVGGGTTSSDSLCPICSQPDGLLACDICSGNFHANCLNMKDSVAAVLVSIIDTTGWVCSDCRRMSKQHFICLKSGQAKLAEEVAQLKTAVLELQDCKRGSSEVLATPEAKATQKTSQKLGVVTAVHLDMAEKQRRAKNVVVTGLQPVDGCDDAKLFLDLCEDNLSVKPYIYRCYRLGRQQEQRVRPLLVQLGSEDNAPPMLLNYCVQAEN